MNWTMSNWLIREAALTAVSRDVRGMSNEIMRRSGTPAGDERIQAARRISTTFSASLCSIQGSDLR
jgi:hypothetical protein